MPSQTIHYRPDIDGLRGIAVLAVVLFHAGFGLSGGYVGVDVFFVISGYLITSIIVRQVQESRFRLIDFFIRRIRRIAPAALVMTASVVLVGLVVMPPAALDQLATSAFCQQFFLSNVYFSMVSGYFAGPAERMPLLHTWTLSVEEQFYVLLPLGLPWMLRRGKVFTRWSLWVLTMVSFVAGIWASTRCPIGAFFLLPTRAWELSAGSLLALHIAGDRSCDMSDDVGKPTPVHWPPVHWPPVDWQSEILAILAFAMLGAAFIGFDDKIAFPGYHAALPVIGTVLLIGLGHSYPSMIHRLLSSRWLVGTGLISYSLYLWHWPILSFLQSILSDPSLSTRLWAVLASLIIAIGSWRWIEQPARNPSWLKPRRIVGLYVVCVMSLAIVTLAIAKTDGLPSRMKPQALAAIESLQIQHQSYATSVTDLRAGSLPRIGSTTSPPTFLVWGDSHALAASEVISRRARELNLSGSIAATGGHPPLLGVSDARQAGLSDRNEAVMEFIQRNRVQHVWLIAAWKTYQDDETMQDGLAQTIERLRANSIQVEVFRQPPVQDFDVGQTYLNQIMFGWPTEMPKGIARDPFQSSRGRLNTIFDRLKKQYENDRFVRWVDPLDEFFNDNDETKTIVAQSPLYVDTNHLTSAGVETFYGHAIDEALKRIVEHDRR